MSERTALYELYDAAGALLYVGISNRPLIRLGEHAHDKDWWPDVATWVLNWHDTRESAAAAEVLVIRTRKPLHNKAIPDEDGIYRIGAGRPAYVLSRQHADLLDHVCAETREAEALVSAGWAAIIRARKAGVPDKVICERTGWSRATLNRKFGPRP